jgi:1-pyrroline-5-carboxylate dehydrogenase
MSFRNELTWLRFQKKDKAERFHNFYELSLQKVKSELGKEYPIYIGGERLTLPEKFEKISPIDYRLKLAALQKCGEEEAKYAVEEAEKAFQSWSRMSYRKRAKLFLKAAEIMSSMKFELAALQSLENGKNRYEAVADVDEAIDYLRFYSLEMIRNRGFKVRMKSAYPGEKAYSELKPYGVWAVISPFNFPLAITVGMSTGALVTGNTVVLKPSSETPLMALKFYEILEKAGLPKGVLNVITGSGEIVGKALIENEKVSGVAFTGSKEVGLESYMRFISKEPRPFIAEMGGKNPVIVSEKADLKKALEGTYKAAFGFGGQKCSAASRLIVHRKVKKKFLSELVEVTELLKIGDPTHRDVFLGPLINRKAVERFDRASDAARKEGRILTGGEVLEGGIYEYGYYVKPTIVEGLPEDHWILKEELFLPFLAVIEYERFDDAIRIANEIEYGLTAGLFTEDPKEKELFFEGVEAGVLYVNRTAGATTGAVVGVQPFVGWKHSSVTGKGAGGYYYLTQFMREKSLTYYEV